MKPRNPVAGNAHRYNKAKVIAPKKGRGSRAKRIRNNSEIFDDLNISDDDVH